VQRLFSTFPNAWPGIGLLILRAAAGFSALAMSHLVSDLTEITALLARCVIVAVTVLLWIGLWTPIAAAAAAVLQICIVGLGQELSAASAVNVALALALAMLGPGSWSLDARLFGRKRIV
jgi:putative oxidoreductase